MTTERITAPLVSKVINDHLLRHELKLDPKLHDVHFTVFGDKGKGGLCNDIEQLQGQFKTITESLEKINGGINKVFWAVILTVLAAVLKLVIIG